MNKLLSSIFVGALCLTLAAPVSAAAAKKPHFQDVPAKHWAYEAIEQAYADGAILGVSEDRYDPSGSLTQAQFMAMLARAVYPREVEAARGKSSRPWYAPELQVAQAHHMLDGLDMGAMDRPMQRYDMALMVYDLLCDWGATLPDQAALYDVGLTIPDFYEVPGRFQDPVRVAFGLDIIRGMDSAQNFRGDATMNRAQAATVYSRLALKLGIGVDVLAPVPEDYDDLQAMMTAVHALTPLHRAGYLSNGKPITPENVAAFMGALEKKFPDGSQWGRSTDYQYDSPRLGKGRGAAAFASMVSDWMFGEEAPILVSQDYGAMKPGDVLRFKNADKADHQWVIRSADENRYDGANGDADGVVSWRTFGGLAPLRQNLNNCGSMSSVVSRY